MAIYIVILLLFFCFACNEIVLKKRKDINGFFLLISFILLWTLATFRQDIGTDFESYESLFNKSTELYEMREGGFILLIELFNDLHLPFAAFNGIMSGLTLFFVYKFILRESPYTFLSILIYFAIGNFYLSSLNVMRQSLSTAIFVCCLPLIRERKLIRYTACVILCTLFIHFSTIILLPLYFFINRSISTKFRLLGIAAATFLSGFVIKIIEMSPYGIYLTFEAFAAPVPLTYYFIAMIAMGVFMYSIHNPAWAKSNICLINLNWLCLMLLCMIFTFAKTPLVMVFHRVLSYFNLIYVVLIPLLLFQQKNHLNIRITYLATCWLMLAFSVSALVINGVTNKLVPYKTIFNI